MQNSTSPLPAILVLIIGLIALGFATVSMIAPTASLGALGVVLGLAVYLAAGLLILKAFTY
jgi:uncharacterized membrane protein HdeD (DUF308 family)